MTRDEFEQLLSEWLDARGNAGLAARIEAAIEADAELGPVRDQWLRLQERIAGGLNSAASSRVDWARFRLRVSQAVDAELSAIDEQDAAFDATLGRLPNIAGKVDWSLFRGRIAASLEETSASSADPDDARLDTLLATLPEIEGRVDWPRFGDRIRRSVRPARARGRILRLPFVPAALAVSGIAAAVLLVFLSRPLWTIDASPVGVELGPSPHSVAMVEVSPENDAEPDASSAETGVAYASLTVLDSPPEQDAPIAAIDENGDVSSGEEIYLVIAAPEPPAEDEDSMTLPLTGL